MTLKTPSSEFEFIKSKLEKVGRLLVSGNHSDHIEAAFLIGCLHTVCIQNIELFAKSECKVALHGQ